MIGTVVWAALWLVNGVVLTYFALLNATYLVTSFLAVGALRRYRARVECVDVTGIIESGGAPPVTVIAPAYNEEASCVESVRSLLTLNYSDHRITVVNDGSTDGTLEALLEAFDMEPAPWMPTADVPTAEIRGTYRSRWHPNLRLVDKENGGKADALNAGLRFCETPLFCAIDMDTLVERDALVRVVWPFLEDRRTVAVGGVIRIANGCRVEDGEVRGIALPRSLLARFQILEYLRAFLSARVGWDAADGLLIISGAFGIFRRSAVAEAGGFWTETVGEDMELVVRLHRRSREERLPYRIRIVPEAVAWTEAPERLKALGSQRDRWQRGLAESLARHRVMLLNRRYGRVGTFAYPYFYFLELMGPMIEIVGYGAFVATILLGWASGAYVAAFILLSVVFGVVISVTAVGLGELTHRRYPRTRDLLHLVWLAVLENFGFRQLNTYWRVRGMVSHLRGDAKGWGELSKKGFKQGTAASAALAALLLWTGAGGAQEAPMLRWEARVFHQRVEFGSELPHWRHAWTESQLGVRRRFDGGSVSLTGSTIRRFGQGDASVSVDAYRDLWDGAYGNLRVLHAPGAEISARRDVSAELFHTFGAGFEAAAGVRAMRFTDENVQVLSAALARYQGPWYLRTRLLVTPKDGERALSLVGQARRFLGGAENFVEVVAAAGQEIVTVGDGPAVELRRTRAFLVRGVHFFADPIGVEAGFLGQRHEGLPSGWGVTLAVRARW